MYRFKISAFAGMTGFAAIYVGVYTFSSGRRRPGGLDPVAKKTDRDTFPYFAEEHGDACL